MNFPTFAISAAAVLTVAFGLLIRSLFLRHPDIEGAAEWLADFSLEKYRPMQRLLNEWDFEFLAKQPGYTVQIEARLRRQRRQIFRMYLRQLYGDFNRLLSIGRFMVLASPEDRSDLEQTMTQLRFRFYWNWVCAQIFISIHPLPAGSASARKLVGALELLQESLQNSAG